MIIGAEKKYIQILRSVFIMSILVLLCNANIAGAENQTSGTCGDNLVWILDDEGTLRVSGTGDMDDYEYGNLAPWEEQKSQIQSIVLESGVTGIGSDAFNNCNNLTSISIPSTVTSIRRSAFAWCENLQELSIPEGMVSLGENMIYHSGLTSLDIPASVIEIGNNSLMSCQSMTAINVADNNPQFTSLDGVLFTKDMGTLITYPGGRSGNYTIPSSVHTIGELAFSDVREINVLTVPGSVTTIERFAFHQCRTWELILEEGIRTIGISAFNGCHIDSGELTIPASVEEISNYAFYMSYLNQINVSEENAYYTSWDGSLYSKDCSRLIYPRYGTTSFVIPDGVTSIAPGAFAYNSGLTSVNLPEGITQIPEECFIACTSLTDVTIPSTVTDIDQSAFLGCESLTGIIIPDGNVSIGVSAFAYCNNLARATIPDSVTSIGEYAFDACSVLTLKVEPDSYALTYAIANNIPYRIAGAPISGTWGDNLTWSLDDNGVLTISGNGMMPDSFYGETPWFAECESIQHVEIDTGITSIGMFAFCNCINMTTISIPNTVTSIGNDPFWGCNSLSHVTIPDSVTSLQNYAFASCQGLLSLEIPASVTEIGNYLVSYSRNVASISVDEANSHFTAVDDVLFSKDMTELISCPAGKTGFYTIPESVTSVRPYAFSCSNLSEIIIPEGITEIVYGFFENCSNLVNVVIPKNVTSIADSAFWGSGLESITVDPENQTFSSVDGIVFNKDITELILCPPAKTGSYTIPDGIIRIGEGAFQDCMNLASVIIPSSVTSIGSYVFSPYYGLTLMVEEDSYALEYAIENEIPYQIIYAPISGTCGADVTWVLDGNGAMTISGTGDMDNYTDENPAPWEEQKECIQYVGIEYGISSIGTKAFNGCSNLTNVYIPSSVASIGQFAFQGCGSLTSVMMDYGVSSIGGEAFLHCGSLVDITIPESVNSIGEYAFSNCSSLTYISIPDSVTSLGVGVFENCSSLSRLVIGHGVTRLEMSAFDRCGNLTNVIIPEGVTYIGEYAFGMCDHLVSITIPASVTGIGNGAFESCDALSYVFYSGSRNQWDELAIGEMSNDRLAGAEIHYGIIAGGTTGDNLIWILDSNGHLTISGSGAMSEYYGDESVPWLSFKDSVTTVEICEGVTNIATAAFSTCNRITEVTIPNSVTSIETHAFYECESLTSLIVPEGVTRIGHYAFSNCKSMESIELPDSLISIQQGAFSGCSSLTEITIPENVLTIESSAFSGCRINNISIPASVTSIGTYAFESCSDLTSIQVSSDNAYYSSLDGVLFDKDMTFLIFCPQGRTGIYEIPAGVENIGTSAFSCCGITGVNIPNSVITIGYYAFSSSSLTSVTIPDSVTAIGESAFSGCNNLMSVTLGNGITYIEDDLFYGCNELTAVTLPANVTAIGNYVFWYCENLTEIHVDGSNPVYASADGMVFSKDMTQFVLCPPGKTGEYTIPDSVTSIGENAFFECSKLTSLTIPASVISIGEGAFGNVYDLQLFVARDSYAVEYAIDHNMEYWFIGEDTIGGTCGNLSWVLDPNGVLTISGDGEMEDFDLRNTWHRYAEHFTKVIISQGVTSIRDEAFTYCPNLTSISIPDSVVSIGNRAIMECFNLTEIMVSNGNEQFSAENGVLFNKDKTEIVRCMQGKSGIYTIPETVTSIGAYAFCGCEQITGVLIPESVTEIGFQAFYFCYGLQELTIPGSVAVIYEDAFEHCNSLTSLTIEDGVRQIGGWAFFDCSSLTHIIIPDSVTDIGDYAFANCQSVEELTIPGGVTSFGFGVFEECYSLTNVTIQDNISYVSPSLFAWCSSLKSVTIPESVTRIDDQAFELCNELSDVYYSGTRKQWAGVQIKGNNESLKKAKIHCSIGNVLSLPVALTVIESEAFADLPGVDSISVPVSVTSIADDAFDKDIMIIAPAGSYAETWADNHGYTVIYP